MTGKFKIGLKLIESSFEKLMKKSWRVQQTKKYWGMSYPTEGVEPSYLLSWCWNGIPDMGGPTHTLLCYFKVAMGYSMHGINWQILKVVGAT